MAFPEARNKFSVNSRAIEITDTGIMCREAANSDSRKAMADAKSVTWNKLVESFTQEFSRFLCAIK